MSRPPDTDLLLRDVLSEGSPPDLREALLAETLILARRRRRFRQTRHLALGLAAIGAFAYLAGRPWTSGSSRPVGIAPSFALVRTQPLAASAIIRTRTMLADEVVSTSPNTAIVRTSPMEFRVINDRELLALISPRPAILIRSGVGSMELEFVNPDDKKVFQPE